jgi:hypothetical protein
MAMKTLINRTGNELRLTLIVRKGDHPDQTAETVDVELGAGADAVHDTAPADGKSARARPSVQEVTYGNDVDIYLSGITATMIQDGSGIGRREVALERGSALDLELNTNDTIEFIYDGKSILVSATSLDSGTLTFSFPVT